MDVAYWNSIDLIDGHKLSELEKDDAVFYVLIKVYYTI